MNTYEERRLKYLPQIEQSESSAPNKQVHSTKMKTLTESAGLSIASTKQSAANPVDMSDSDQYMLTFSKCDTEHNYFPEVSSPEESKEERKCSE